MLFISRGNGCSCFVFDLYHQARSSLNMLESRKGFELKILKALGTELTVQTQNMLYHLGEEWQKLAVWKLPPSKGTRPMNGSDEWQRSLAVTPLLEY